MNYFNHMSNNKFLFQVSETKLEKDRFHIEEGWIVEFNGKVRVRGGIPFYVFF